MWTENRYGLNLGFKDKNMGKVKRKQRPQPPWWWNLDNDNCWFCKNRNNCNQCKLLKKFKRKKVKNNASELF